MRSGRDRDVNPPSSARQWTLLLGQHDGQIFVISVHPDLRRRPSPPTTASLSVSGPDALPAFRLARLNDVHRRSDMQFSGGLATAGPPSAFPAPGPYGVTAPYYPFGPIFAPAVEHRPRPAAAPHAYRTNIGGQRRDPAPRLRARRPVPGSAGEGTLTVSGSATADRWMRS